MGRKKSRKVVFKPWCWYCEREFEDEKVLIQHQKARHFKCHICAKRLNTANGMVIHVAQVHKENIKHVPNALPGRDKPDLEIFGSIGIPSEDVAEYEQRMSEKLGEPVAKKSRPQNSTGGGGSGMVASSAVDPEQLRMQLEQHRMAMQQNQQRPQYGGYQGLPHMPVPPAFNAPSRPPMPPMPQMYAPAMGRPPMPMPLPQMGFRPPVPPMMGMPPRPPAPMPMMAPPLPPRPHMPMPMPMSPATPAAQQQQQGIMTGKPSVSSEPPSSLSITEPISALSAQSPVSAALVDKPMTKARSTRLIYADPNLSVEERRAQLIKYRFSV
ncbi:hypothetical protein H4R99_004192 [Coemansia sp. RSA 1722]